MKTSGSQKIAQRYVSAFFDAAQQTGALSAVEKDFSTLATLIETHADFRAFLANPLLSAAAQEATIVAVLQSLGAHALTVESLALLARKKRLTLLADVAAQFQTRAEQARGEMRAELVVAKPVSSEERAKVAAALGKACGKKINLSVREDRALVGGVVINVGSLQLDDSLAGKLNRLKTALHTA